MTTYISAEQLNKNLEELFKDWKENSYYKDIYKNYFFKDGVIDGKKYLQQDIKVLFLLKETDGNKFQSIKCFYDTYFSNNYTRRSPMWYRLREWAEGILKGKPFAAEWAEGHCNIHNYDKISEQNIARIQDEDDRLRQVAVVNVNKYFGSAVAVDTVLEEHAKKDRKYLIEEIKYLNPDIIVCGNTWRLLEIIAESSLTDLCADDPNRDGGKLTLDGKDIMVIDMYHPAAPKTKKDMFDMLMTKYAKLYLKLNK